MKSWKGLHVLIIGAARQGLALARYLSSKGAIVTLNDKKPASAFPDVIREMKTASVEVVFSGHPLELLIQTDLVCLSGGIPLTLPLIVEAEKRGILISNDSQIFMELVPCPVIGITGSAGKTTTTTLVNRMAQNFIKPPQKAWVGGNIGLPLIDFVDQMKPNDLVIMELSSFQLEQMTISPQYAVILNITPNHLDRHGTLEKYTAAKARILAYQSPQDTAVLNREDAGSWALAQSVKGHLVSFGKNRPDDGVPGTFLEDGNVYWTNNHEDEILMPAKLISLRGQHNLDNVLAACAISKAAGFPANSMRIGVEEFTGVPHRLELVQTCKGVAWYNDSIATAPERTMAAIRAFSEPLVLLLGGRDKNLPWQDLAELIQQRVDHVILFGEAGEMIEQQLYSTAGSSHHFTILRVQKLQEAINTAALIAEEGDVILLSPGCTSFDEFRDFEERGERFKQWVKQLP